MKKGPAMPKGNLGEQAVKEDRRKGPRQGKEYRWPQSHADQAMLDAVDEKRAKKKFNGDPPSNFGKL